MFIVNEFKKCPCCGGKAKLESESISVGWNDTDKVFWIECCNCGIQTKKYSKRLDDNLEEDMFNAWNFRLHEN